MEAKMNALLSDLVFFYHKLQSYHWYISGHTFFQTHAKLEEYYDDIRPQIDEVAETMLMSGYRPVSTMAAFARHAKVKDATEGFVGDVKVVYASILGDFKHLLESVKAIKADADASNNYLVSAKMDDYIESYSKAIWMISQASM